MRLMSRFRRRIMLAVMAAISCFSGGYWANGKPWDNGKGWKD